MGGEPFLRKSKFGGLDLVVGETLSRYYSHIKDGNGLYHFNIRYDFSSPYNTEVSETGENVVNVFSVEQEQLTEVVKYLMAVKDFYEGAKGLELDDRVGEEFNSKINRVQRLKSYEEEFEEFKNDEHTAKIHLDRREKQGLALAMDQIVGVECCGEENESQIYEVVTLNHYYLNPNEPEFTFTRKEEGAEDEVNKYSVKPKQLPSLIEYLMARVDNLEFSGDQKIKDDIGQRYRVNKTKPSESQI